jgi:hypothetical protein
MRLIPKAFYKLVYLTDFTPLQIVIASTFHEVPCTKNETLSAKTNPVPGGITGPPCSGGI